jgi:ECF sigma factor
MRAGTWRAPVGQSHLAVHAEFRVRLHDVRQHDCAVVPRRCAIVSEAPARRDARRQCVNDGDADFSSCSVSEHLDFAPLGGLDITEAAALLDVSEATIQRDWRAAKAWLTEQIVRTRGDGG